MQRRPDAARGHLPPSSESGVDGNSTSRPNLGRRGPHVRGGGESRDAKPQRPGDVAEWKPEDFRSARVERDRKLSKAVTVAGEKWSHNAKLVNLLVELLAVDEPPETPAAADHNGGRFGRGGGQDRSVHVDASTARAIIGALGHSETPQALEALENLIIGRQEAPLDFSVTVKEVLQALTSKLSVEREALLLRIFTQPEMIQPAPSKFVSTSTSGRGSRFDRGLIEGRVAQGGKGADGVDPVAIQQQILQQAGPDTSEGFRTGVALHLKDPNVTIETAEIAERFLAEDDPRNLTAQLLLYRNPETAGKTREQLVTRLIAGSGSMIDLLFGIPPQSGRLGSGRYSRSGLGPNRGLYRENVGRSRRPSFDGPLDRGGRPSSRPSSRQSQESTDEPAGELDLERLHCDFVRQLWTESTVAPLTAVIQKAGPKGDRFSTRSEIPLLLASIPLGESRDALRKLFEARKEEGPSPWTSLGMFGGKTVDPGVLVVAKNAYYKRLSRRPSSSSRTNGGSRWNGAPNIDPQERQWASAVEKFVEVLCERCRDASRLRTEVDTAAAESMPVNIPKNANVVAEYHIRWPERIDPRLSDVPVGLLDLHYVRIEDEARPDRAVTAFRRLAGRAEERTISGGVWLDGFNKAAQRSTDIRITTTGRGFAVRNGGYDRGGGRSTGRDDPSPEPVPLVVEILTVAIAEPPE